MAEVSFETLDPAQIKTDAGDAAAGAPDARRPDLLAQIHTHPGAQIDRPLVCRTGDGDYEALRHAAVIDAARRTGDAVAVLVVDADEREVAALRLAFTGHTMSPLDRIDQAGRLLGVLGAGSQRLAPYTVRDVAHLMHTSRETVNADLKPRADLLAQEASKDEDDRLSPEEIAAMTRTCLLYHLGRITEDERKDRIVRQDKQRFGGNVQRVERDAGPQAVARLIHQKAADPRAVEQALRQLNEAPQGADTSASAANAAGDPSTEAPSAGSGPAGSVPDAGSDAVSPGEPAEAATRAGTSGVTDGAGSERRAAKAGGQRKSRKGTNTTPVVDDDQQNDVRRRVQYLEKAYNYRHVDIAEVCQVGAGQISELLTSEHGKRAETISRIEAGLRKLEAAHGISTAAPAKAD
jgi:hypothetical protein